jgi:hypothetical protein
MEMYIQQYKDRRSLKQVQGICVVHVRYLSAKKLGKKKTKNVHKCN